MVMMMIMMMVMMMMMMMMMPLHCKTIVDQFFLQFLDCICICICVFLYLCQNHWTDDGSCFHAIQWPHPTSEHLLCFLCIFLTGQPCKDRLILPLFLKEKHIDTCFIIWWWWCIFVFLHFLYFCIFCIFCIFVFFVFFVFFQQKLKTLQIKPHCSCPNQWPHPPSEQMMCFWQPLLPVFLTESTAKKHIKTRTLIGFPLLSSSLQPTVPYSGGWVGILDTRGISHYCPAS